MIYALFQNSRTYVEYMYLDNFPCKLRHQFCIQCLNKSIETHPQHEASLKLAIIHKTIYSIYSCILASTLSANKSICNLLHSPRMSFKSSSADDSGQESRR
jgi:hypothetical protein